MFPWLSSITAGPLSPHSSITEMYKHTMYLHLHFLWTPRKEYRCIDFFLSQSENHVLLPGSWKLIGILAVFYTSNWTSLTEAVTQMSLIVLFPPHWLTSKLSKIDIPECVSFQGPNSILNWLFNQIIHFIMWQIFNEHLQCSMWHGYSGEQMVLSPYFTQKTEASLLSSY